MRKGQSVSDRAVARWIRTTLAADPPRARSLIVTVWGDALAPHGGELWLAALIALMGAFGMAERTVRTGVFRLAADGWVEGESRGRQSRYRLTARGREAIAAAHRRIYFPHPDDWDGRWELAIAPPESLSPAGRAALNDTLAWSGFAALAPGLHARPHAAEAQATPLPPALAGKLTLVGADDAPAGTPGGTLAALALARYDLVGVAARYRGFLARFGPALALFGRGGTHDPRQCFVARTLLIHAFRRALLRDPLLPSALLPPAWPGDAAYTLVRDFYRRVREPAERFLGAVLGEDFGDAPQAFARRFDEP